VNGQDNLTKLKAENKLLQERLKLLQSQNDQLLKQLQQQEQGGKYGDNNHKKPYEQRLVLEDFEGEETFFNGWNKREKRYVDELNAFDDGFDGDDYEEEDNAAFLPSAVSSTSSSTAVSVAVKNIGIAGDDDDDDELGLAGVDEDELICEYDDKSGLFKNSIGECPVEPNVTFLDAMKSRAYWLVGLLALQSCSGFILSRNELLLQDHPVIVYFLTMLVGAGGNAGNQASVRVIRGLALGTLNSTTQTQFLSRELRMAFALSAILSLAGFFRAIVFQTPFPETMAVTLALSMIVFSSICLGAILPLVLQKMGVDPAHSSTTIQVIMDILGVVLTVFVSTAVLDSVWGKMLVKSLSSMGL
jgi:cation transporter-like permease